MEDFELIHKVCSKPATIRFHETENEIFDNETGQVDIEYNNELSLDCPTCRTSTEVSPK